MEKTEREIKDEIRRLRWEAEAMEAQRKINEFVGMGFRSWQNHKDVNEGDAVVTVHNDYTVGFIPHVDLKNWSFYIQKTSARVIWKPSKERWITTPDAISANGSENHSKGTGTTQSDMLSHTGPLPLYLTNHGTRTEYRHRLS